MLMGALSADTVKERQDKNPAPDNCEYLSVTTVNEEIWDLMSRGTRSVDLPSKEHRNHLFKVYICLVVWAGKQVSDIQQGKTPDTRSILDHVMDGCPPQPC